MRVTVADFQRSRIPGVLGKCAGDLPSLCSYLNEATQRLMNAGGETGFWGSWAKVAFSVDRLHPYITVPLQFARIINMDVCKCPVRIQNQFYEYMEDGIGLQTPCDGRKWNGILETYERGLWSTAIDLPPANQYLRVYITDARDVNVQILFSGAKDQNENGIYGQNGFSTVGGLFLVTATPFVTSAMIVTSFDAIAKPVTYGDIVLKAVDATTGDETFLSRYTPTETNPAYRRYFINRLPANCCNQTPPPSTVTVSALCKYEFQPVFRETDFLLIGNIPALKEECQSVRYGEMDTPGAAQMSAVKHQEAIRLLNQEMDHYLGKTQPAVVFAPFGSAKLERRQIGTMV